MSVGIKILGDDTGLQQEEFSEFDARRSWRAASLYVVWLKGTAYWSVNITQKCFLKTGSSCRRLDSFIS